MCVCVCVIAGEIITDLGRDRVESDRFSQGLENQSVC